MRVEIHAIISFAILNNKMKPLYFNHLCKKEKHVGFRVSEYEKDQIDQFCHREQISITDFLRYAIRKVINEKSAK